MYRDKELRIKEKEARGRGRDRTSWFRNKGFTGILKIDCTPGGKLSKSIQKRLNKELPKDLRIKVLEQTGTQVKKIVCNSVDTKPEKKCLRKDCYICSSSDRGSGGKCWWQGVNYEISCKRCEGEGKRTVYVGESKGGYRRALQHEAGLRLRQQNNV